MVDKSTQLIWLNVIDINHEPAIADDWFQSIGLIVNRHSSTESAI